MTRTNQEDTLNTVTVQRECAKGLAPPLYHALRRLDLVPFFPGGETALQGRRVETHFIKPPRRTGAGRLVRSGAVGDYALAFYLAAGGFFTLPRPLVYLVGGDPDGTWNAGGVGVELRAGSDVEHDRWVVAVQHLV